jgi:hypothetical protein
MANRQKTGRRYLRRGALGVCSVLPLLCITPMLELAADGGSANRVTTWDEASLACNLHGKKVAVLLRASDWCSAGEMLKTNVWDTPEFAAALGSDTTLLTLDWPEYRQVGDVQRQAAKSAESADVLAITANTATGGVEFEALADGSVLVVGEEAGWSVMSFAVSAGDRPVRRVVIELLPHDSLPGGGPARNANVVLTEVVGSYRAGAIGGDIEWQSAIANVRQGHLAAAAAIDGVTKGGNGWCIASKHHACRLILTPEKPIPAHATLDLKLHFTSTWKQHLPGRLRFAALREEDEKIRQWESLQSQIEATKVARKGWKHITGNFPAVFVFGPTLRLAGSRHGASADMTVAETVELIDGFIAGLSDKDAFAGSIDVATGLDKAAKIGELLTIGRYRLQAKGKHALEDRYQELLVLDPRDTLGYIRSFSFAPATFISKAKELEKAGRHSEAVALIDAQFENPLNKRVPATTLQSLFFWKYKNLTKTPEEKKAALLQTVSCAPDTTIGIGSEGYLLWHHNTGPPTMYYGWKERHVKQGTHSMMIDADVYLRVECSGWNAIIVKPKAPKDSTAAFKVEAITVLINGEEVATRQQVTNLDETGEYYLKLPEWESTDKLSLRVDYTAAAAGASLGRLVVTPYFEWELPENANTGAAGRK